MNFRHKDDRLAYGDIVGHTGETSRRGTTADDTGQPLVWAGLLHGRRLQAVGHFVEGRRRPTARDASTPSSLPSRPSRGKLVRPSNGGYAKQKLTAWCGCRDQTGGLGQHSSRTHSSTTWDTKKNKTKKQQAKQLQRRGEADGWSRPSSDSGCLRSGESTKPRGGLVRGVSMSWENQVNK